MTHRIGQQLGNYRLTRLLGQGGFADVYLGEHLYLNTKAAIKVLQAHITNEDSSLFLNEARTIAALVHPHIVRVLDFGLEGYTPYLVMDYASHGTLRQYLPKGVPMSPQRILPYVKQIASALQYAHERKIVHRDIKPENMLLGSHHESLLSDFGIAIASQSSRFDGMGAMVGTVSYIAPEQIQGRSVTASDQYALDIVVYEWLAGDRPFHGTFTEVATQHMLVPPPPLRQQIPSLPLAIEHVVATALAKDPQQRFATIQVFAQAFESACQEDIPTSLSPVSSPEIMAQDDSAVLVQQVSTLPATLPAIFANTPPWLQQTSQRTESVPPLFQPLSPSSVKQGIPRRTFVLGMAGMAVFVVAGGAIAWWEASQRSTSPQSV